jgi:hypothetical protein
MGPPLVFWVAVLYNPVWVLNNWKWVNDGLIAKAETTRVNEPILIWLRMIDAGIDILNTTYEVTRRWSNESAMLPNRSCIITDENIGTIMKTICKYDEVTSKFDCTNVISQIMADLFQVPIVTCLGGLFLICWYFRELFA